MKYRTLLYITCHYINYVGATQQRTHIKNKQTNPKPTNQLTPTNQQTNKTIKQPTNRPTNQPTNQPTKQIKHTGKQIRRTLWRVR